MLSLLLSPEGDNSNSIWHTAAVNTAAQAEHVTQVPHYTTKKKHDAVSATCHAATRQQTPSAQTLTCSNMCPVPLRCGLSPGSWVQYNTGKQGTLAVVACMPHAVAPECCVL